MMSFVLSCSPEKQQVAEAPSPAPTKGVTITSKLEILPIEATKETTFYISSKGIDASKIQWLVNNKPVEGATGIQFKPLEIKKGNVIQAKAVIKNQEVASNQITIKNIQPTIVRARIVPSVPKVNDILRADVIGNDRDGDRVSFIYEWSKNGEPSGRGEILEGPFKRGDKISVKIMPFDEEDYGQPIILTTEIFNSPPKPSLSGEGRLEDNIYIYQIKATDPDGDKLAFNLKQAPEGAVINKSTGLISWRVSEKDTGRHPVSVQITDGHGGEVLYNFEVTIGFEGSR